MGRDPGSAREGWTGSARATAFGTAADHRDRVYHREACRAVEDTRRTMQDHQDRLVLRGRVSDMGPDPDWDPDQDRGQDQDRADRQSSKDRGTAADRLPLVLVRSRMAHGAGMAVVVVEEEEGMVGKGRDKAEVMVLRAEAGTAGDIRLRSRCWWTV